MPADTGPATRRGAVDSFPVSCAHDPAERFVRSAMAAPCPDRGHQRRPAVGPHAFGVDTHTGGDLDTAGHDPPGAGDSHLRDRLGGGPLHVIWFLSAFLLLIKVERTTGWIRVTAQGPAFVHATQIPASGPETAADVVAQVNYARSLTATAQQ